MYKISENANNNYLAKIVKLKNGRKHSNADRLQCWTIDFQNVITDLSYQEGDIVVFFALESQINKDFISSINGFEDKTLNLNKDVKGFFNKHGRVRAISLRGEKSEGFVIKLDIFESWLGAEYSGEKYLNQEFDFYGDKEICRKYVSFDRTARVNNPKQSKSVKNISRLVENQFFLHGDTDNLRKNIHKINPEDIIGIHYKKHGTSVVIGNVLVKRNLTWLERIAKRFGVQVKETQYDIIYSSRKVIKNQYLNPNQNHFYGEDIWGVVAKEVKDLIPKNWTLYGEILGYTPSGSPIQGSYDYGCKPGEHKFYVYKISVVNEDGTVVFLTDNQIKDFCDRVGLLYTDTFIYYGKAENFDLDFVWSENVISQQSSIEKWRTHFLESLQQKFNENDCYMCTNRVPEEGIVLRRENLWEYEAYKLKSFRFLKMETEQLDKEIVDIEEQQKQE